MRHQTPTMFRRAAAAFASAALALTLAGCVGTADVAAASSMSTQVTGPIAVTGAAAPTSSAAKTLATLTVRGKGPKTGYQRTVKFGSAWLDVDRNGCDTRDDILARDLVSETKEGSCKVLTGVLHDQYTGRTIHFVRGVKTSMAVQIDHRVALLDAWQSGAPKLSQARREALANDPINLVAVDGPTNSQKGASDTAAWLPPQKSYRCTYVAAQIAVKAKYGLSVTAAERAAMTRVLGTCGKAGPAPVVAPVPAPRVTPAPKPAPAPATTPSTGFIHPGSWCPTRGAIGHAATGKAYTCGSKGPDAAGKFHWNS